MADDWIKMRVDLGTDPAVLAIAESLGIDPDTVVGKLHKLWSWADRHLADGNAPSVTLAFVDRYVCAPGFAQAMIEVGWLARCNGGFQFPNYDAHMSTSAKKRGLTAKRAGKHRKRASRNSNAASVTEALPEKEKEKSIKKKTTSSSVQTQTGVWGSGPITLDTRTRRWLGVTDEDLAAWADAYPACDVAGELRRALEWCLSNPAKGRKKLYRKFLTGWLGRQQDRGGSQRGNSNPYGPQTGHNTLLDLGDDDAGPN